MHSACTGVYMCVHAQNFAPRCLLIFIYEEFKKKVEEKVSVLNEASSDVQFVTDSLAEFEQMLNITPKGSVLILW